MLIINGYWYIAAPASELTKKPIKRKVEGESIVLWRDSSGKPHALRDRCAHRGMAKADFDRDGDVDMIITNYKSPTHYYVNKVAKGHWLQVRLRGRENNRDGIGAIIRVRTGENKQLRIISAGDGYASQFSRVAHFGVGENERIDELEVSWPNTDFTDRPTIRHQTILPSWPALNFQPGIMERKISRCLCNRDRGRTETPLETKSLSISPSAIGSGSSHIRGRQ